MLPGYSLTEELHRGRKHIVWRATRESDGETVVIKSTSGDRVDERDLLDLTREFELLRALSLDGVVSAQEMVSRTDAVHLILEDSKLTPLSQLISSQEVELRDRLAIAIALTQVLAEVHGQGVIHKDINPSNILVDPDTNSVQLIDFGIATRQTEEHTSVSHPRMLEGTLAYVSPEQTGRMNRPVDYRSDYYSLGVTLFEFFTHEVPFRADDPMELVHAHVALPAPHPGERGTALPVPLSQILQALLEKAPEDRYQSAIGIQRDLEFVLESLDNPAQSEFVPARFDVRDRFSIPKRLYGRENELNVVLAGFDRIAVGGAELILVSGYSGIGKSEIAHTVQSAVTTRRGRFVSGKFDQLPSTVPYTAMAAAFRDLVRQLLTETDDALAVWKDLLSNELGGNAQLIIEVVPELELVLGPQEPLRDLGATGAKNRFLIAFQQFVRAFSKQEHPVVLFLDDLQWADPASLTLLESILNDESEHLLVIGAYRDNEVDDSHPVRAMTSAIRSSGVRITELQVEPIADAHLARLLGDTLNRSTDEIDDFTELVAQKTGNNPFFVRQFLSTVHSRGALRFEPDTNSWTWDIAAIDEMNITDNVVELMVDRLKELPVGSQRALQYAACIGNAFDLTTLAVISDEQAQVDDDLQPAIDAGLVIQREPTGVRPDEDSIGSRESAYRFLHDRVQQAAYSLIDDSEKSIAHLRIGERLAASLDEAALEERLFEIVDHFNVGRHQIEGETDRQSLAERNLAAAKRALGANAYEAARDYAVAGIDCLPNDAWSNCYELARDLDRCEANAAYLRGDFERSEEIVGLMLSSVHTPVEKAELHSSLTIQYTLSGRYGKAIESAREGLALLGVDLPSEGLDASLERELEIYRNALGDRSLSDLRELPEMHSPEMIVAVRLLSDVCPLAYIAQPDLFPVAAGRIVNLTLEHGLAPHSPFGFAFFGLTHSSVLHEFEPAYELGRLAMDLAHDREDRSMICRTSHPFCAFINHWSRPLAEFLEPNQSGFQAGLQSGELQFAGYHWYNRSLNLFHMGQKLPQLIQSCEEMTRFTQRTRNQHATDPIQATRRVALDLSGKTPEAGSFDTEEISFDELISDLRSREARPTLCHFGVMRAWALLLYGHLDDAHRSIEEAREYQSFISGHMSTAVLAFVDALLLSLAPGTEEAARSASGAS